MTGPGGWSFPRVEEVDCDPRPITPRGGGDPWLRSSDAWGGKRCDVLPPARIYDTCLLMIDRWRACSALVEGAQRLKGEAVDEEGRGSAKSTKERGEIGREATTGGQEETQPQTNQGTGQVVEP